MNSTANRPMTTTTRYGSASASIIATADRYLPATQIDFHGNGTATVHSPRTGTEYTVDERGNCNCQAQGTCWHGVAVIKRREELAIADPTKPSVYSSYVPATRPVEAEAQFAALWKD